MEVRLSRMRDQPEIYDQLLAAALKKGSKAKFIILRDEQGHESAYIFAFTTEHKDMALDLLAQHEGSKIIGGGKLVEGKVHVTCHIFDG
jgi:hypothetical protein